MAQNSKLITKTLVLVFLLISTLSTSAQRKRKDYLVTIETSFGTMHAILYDEAIQHKKNFLKLVEDKFYDGLLFHRVIQSFMIQGGDPASKNAKEGVMLGEGDVGYQVPAEITATLFHKKGALAAARDNNPAKASSGCQFYIVQGKVWDDNTLTKQMARSPQRIYTDEQKNVYKTIGGTPHLDGNYTVFGQVIDNLWVIDSVAKQSTDKNNRPITDIVMKITCKKMKKKRISKLFTYQYL